MILMDFIVKEGTTTSDKLADYGAQETGCKKNNEGESSTSRRGENETKERRPEDEGANERNKFKKVKMPIFNGEDPNSSLGITHFPVVYGRTPPPLIYYGDQSTSNFLLDEQLKARDEVLEVLKEHLRVAQDKMKKNADSKRRDVEYKVGDMVF